MSKEIEKLIVDSIVANFKTEYDTKLAAFTNKSLTSEQIEELERSSDLLIKSYREKLDKKMEEVKESVYSYFTLEIYATRRHSNDEQGIPRKRQD